MDNRSFFIEQQKIAPKHAKARAFSSSFAPAPAALASSIGGNECEAYGGFADTPYRNDEDACERPQACHGPPAILRSRAPPQGRPYPSRMGVTFRDSSSNKTVVLGKRTVKDGECCGVWDMAGKYSVILGPRREWFAFSRVCFFNRHVADSHQYLEVRHRNGKKEHK